MAKRSVLSPDEQLADALATYRADPLGYVMFAFPWDTERSIQLVPLAQGVEEFMTDADRERRAAYRARFPGCEFGPDLWACDFLEELGREIRMRGFDGRMPVRPIRFATVSGHEIGKSVLCAWLSKFILDTRAHSVGTMTAVTDEQLRTKTWAEVGKWHHISVTAHWFNFTSARGSMSLTHVDKRFAGKWRLDARTARKEKSEAFAGQHAPTSTSFYIFDEASGIESKVFEVREGGLSSGEPMVFDFGNGTQNSGAFYNEIVQDKRYIARSIDSRTVAMTNKVKIAEDVASASGGEDDDFVRVRWRGLFPKGGGVQLIGTELCEQAMERELPETGLYASTIGVDVARFGDAKTVIYPRRGYDFRSFAPRAFTGLSVVEVCDKVAGVVAEMRQAGHAPQRIFVDESGVGGGVVDLLRARGFPVEGVHFGGRPLDRKTYRMKVDEMWCQLRDALPRMALPERGTPEGEAIWADLTQRQYRYTISDQLTLESKDDMRKRGLSSPDYGDALALNFAGEVAPMTDAMREHMMARAGSNHDYDPHERI